jgi:hypothetical protein
MTTVVCVMRSGGDYTPAYVWALKRGLARHNPEYDFRVLSDLDCFGPWGIRLRHNWPGWWSLVEWWRDGLFDTRVIAMGLDTLITGDLSDIASYDGPIAGISDFYHPRLLASGVMVWQPDAGAELYERFAREPDAIMRRYPRMDPWMRSVIPHAGRLQAHAPGHILSYKKHCRGGLPKGARICCFHGKPRPADPRAGWAHTAWLSLHEVAA